MRINEDHAAVVFVFLVIIIVSVAKYMAMQKELINECEQHLPRDKHCHLIAAPEDEK